MVKEIGDKVGITFSTNNLANTNYILGSYSDALSLEFESLQTAVDLNHKLFIATSLAGLGAILIETGKAKKGSKLLGVCDAQLEALQEVLATEDQRFYDKGTTSAISRLGKRKFEQAKVEGRTMTMEQAIIFAQRIAKK